MRLTPHRALPLRSGYSTSLRGYALVAVGAICWGSLGLFYHVVVGNYGLTPLEAVFWRALVATIFLGTWLGWRQREAFRVQPRDIVLFLLLGLIGIAATFAIYAYAIRSVGMGVAAVLQYTAPAWVTLFSVCFWHERLSPVRVAALLLALAGVALVGRAYEVDAAGLSLIGVAAALVTGVTYASYVLMIKTATQRGYSPGIIMFYALVVGTLCLLPMQSRQSITIVTGSPGVIVWLLALGVITLAAGVTFSAGVKHVPASSASIVATVEPLTAMLLGWLVLGEGMAVPQIAGAVCILAAVSVLQLRLEARNRPRLVDQFQEQDVAAGEGY